MWGWSGWGCGGPTEQVDDAFIISGEEPDRVFKEEHEGRIDDSIRQLVGIDLKGCSQHTHTHTRTFISLLLCGKDGTQRVAFVNLERELETRATDWRGGRLHL